MRRVIKQGHRFDFKGVSNMADLKAFDDVLKGCTLDYFKSGQYKIEFADFLALKAEGKAMMLDLRTKEEAEVVALPFARNVPIDELPQALADLPKDKLIVTFCASGVRAIMAFFYLKAAGYDCKIYMGKLNDLTGNFMPPFVAKNYDNLRNE